MLLHATLEDCMSPIRRHLEINILKKIVHTLSSQHSNHFFFSILWVTQHVRPQAKECVR
jgi:hypothetical protein